jgi:alpha-D-ribose 1-methylphosphonate 5-triphosphate synthase subunit PhnG
MTKKKIAAAGLISLAALQSAHAEGWIAKHIIKPVAGEHAAREADKLHEQAGKPLDEVAKAAEAAAAAAALAALKAAGGGSK